jgi:hypothetical protein
MKLIKLILPLILTVLLNCAGQEAVEAEASSAKAPVSGGTSVTANSIKAYDSSGTLIGYASNVTPWMITVVFSNGYFSVIDFGGNHIGNSTVFYYNSSNCTGTPYVKYTQGFFAKTLFKSQGLYYKPSNSDSNGVATTTSVSIGSSYEQNTGNCTVLSGSSQSVYQLSQVTLSTLGLQTSYSAPISIQYN